MHVALQTIILEDVFGKDNQYLKGQEYDLSYSDWTMVKSSSGRSIQSFNSYKLLAEEDMSRYFRYEESEVIRGGIGNR